MSYLSICTLHIIIGLTVPGFTVSMWYLNSLFQVYYKLAVFGQTVPGFTVSML